MVHPPAGSPSGEPEAKAQSSPRPELAALQIADPPDGWAALGFTVGEDGIITIGGVELWLDAAGHGITGWTLRRTAQPGDVDGLPTGLTSAPPPPPVAHPNQAIAIDQIVVTTPDFDRTAAALHAAGLPLRRISEPGEDRRALRQGFRRLGEVILELVEAPTMAPGPARFWGLVITVADLRRLHGDLAPRLTDIRAAVQPGRHITALRDAPGIGARLAFMDPEPPGGGSQPGAAAVVAG
jgi:hypothetical protein